MNESTVHQMKPITKKEKVSQLKDRENADQWVPRIREALYFQDNGGYDVDYLVVKLRFSAPSAFVARLDEVFKADGWSVRADGDFDVQLRITPRSGWVEPDWAKDLPGPGDRVTPGQRDMLWAMREAARAMLAKIYTDMRAAPAANLLVKVDLPDMAADLVRADLCDNGWSVAGKHDKVWEIY